MFEIKSLELILSDGATVKVPVAGKKFSLQLLTVSITRAVYSLRKEQNRSLDNARYEVAKDVGVSSVTTIKNHVNSKVT